MTEITDIEDIPVLDVPTTNKVDVPKPERRPIAPFDFKDMITTGNIEEVRKRNAAEAGAPEAQDDPEPKKKGGRPKKAD
jgi:hypothetical protein